MTLKGNLILKRRVRQSITIGDNMDIKITLLGSVGKQIKIGIECDRSIPIFRSELLTNLEKDKDVL
jgi:carbon storage regulator CsrA